MMMVNLCNYVLLDAARMEGALEKAKDANSDFDSLYRGRSEEELADVAPYLFTFPGTDEFSSWFLETGWGNSWGVYIVTPATMEELRKHFRKFLLVNTEDGKELYFRFYDPRVLRIFLPTCDEQQLKEFFGPVQKFVCEDKDTAFALLFSFDGRQLLTERVAAETIFSATKHIPMDDSLAATNNDSGQEKRKPPRRFFY